MEINVTLNAKYKFVEIKEWIMVRNVMMVIWLMGINAIGNVEKKYVVMEEKMPIKSVMIGTQ